VVGYFLIDTVQGLLPYALAVAAASFIYIALSDLLPEMMRRTSLAHSLPQVAYIAAGVALAALVTSLMHAH
jgi:zinc and cadmium transporter